LLASFYQAKGEEQRKTKYKKGEKIIWNNKLSRKQNTTTRATTKTRAI
jgi:hypothetical protein